MEVRRPAMSPEDSENDDPAGMLLNWLSTVGRLAGRADPDRGHSPSCHGMYSWPLRPEEVESAYA